MEEKSTGTAYLLWALGLCGVSGIQRFYLGHTGVGLLYLFTWGLCGIGQLIDLFLIPGNVKVINHRSKPHYPVHNIIVNTKEHADVKQVTSAPIPAQSFYESTSTHSSKNRSKAELERAILQACKDGPTSLAHITLSVGEESEKIKRCMDSMTENGLIRQDINSNGVLTYEIC